MSGAGDAVFSASFCIPADASESLESLLFDLGALSVTLTDAGDEPILEPAPGEHPVWPRVVLSAHFADAGTAEKAGAAARALTSAQVTFSQLSSEQWRDPPTFDTLTFGDTLEIVATDHDKPPRSGRARVHLRPGLAFGTGLHPTTALCLEHLANSPPRGLACTDFGCGSGILGLAALALGGRSVLAIDHDDQALEAARSNAKLNRFPGALTVSPPCELPAASADLVMANILLRPLVELADTLVAHLRPNGRLILSGILRDQVDELRAAYAPTLTEVTLSCRDEWCLLAGRRRSKTMG